MTTIGLEFFNSWIEIIFGSIVFFFCGCGSILFDGSKGNFVILITHVIIDFTHNLTCLPTRSLLANLLNCDFRGKVQEKLQKLLLADLEAILLRILILKNKISR